MEFIILCSDQVFGNLAQSEAGNNWFWELKVIDRDRQKPTEQFARMKK